MNCMKKFSILGSSFLLMMVLGYLAYHCCIPATDLLTKRVALRIIQDVELFESGGKPLNTITLLSGGLSGAKLYKVTERNMAFVVRHIENRSDYDKAREIAAQQRASKGGWGPRVYYVD